VCVCVCVCERVLLRVRASVVLDLFPFGSRKCACAGGVGDAGVGGRSVEWQGREKGEGRVGGEENGRIK
jgi:hypothetical protein